jgi:hypothetical protein
MNVVVVVVVVVVVKSEYSGLLFRRSKGLNNNMETTQPSRHFYNLSLSFQINVGFMSYYSCFPLPCDAD